MGHIEIRDSVMVNIAMLTGLKSRILGYMSNGDSVCRQGQQELDRSTLMSWPWLLTLWK
ncbi:hypothetical protein DPMN_099592 [Dreissena polymorpha]|uniref:Uncharacterized protein n=1 Tax=Dreissena polymorpha TaxID=45954 RepID=A0A9D4R8B5_DREPO|nr:hypothetical protein DPMN_099592 [Dreissena polymorpha]